MKLNHILKNIATLSVVGDTEMEIGALTFDSREAKSGSLFFAMRGTNADGHKYIGSAIEGGAKAIVCETLPETLAQGVTYIQVADSELAVAQAAAEFYDHPSRKLKLVGITGTNGKTTTATLLYELMRKLGYKAGLISTVVYKIGDRSIPSTHTTPDAIRLNAMLAEMAEEGCEYCFMEVSSHSIVQHRVAALHFTGGIFTNLTRDHLDYHHTMQNSINAKKAFFDALPRDSFALTNKDDRNGMVMVQNTKAKISTYSLRGMADFRARVVEMHPEGMLMQIDSRELWVKLIGKFNAYNLLSIYAAAILLGGKQEEVLRTLSTLESVDGRFQTIHSDTGITAIVDYAHTPDALQNIADTLNEIDGAGRLFIVVGCGGDRDHGKRKDMGRIAANEAYMAILTSDNPRHEDPDKIIEEMKQGVEPGRKYIAITDRREAIRTAVMMAERDDVILIAGKGHETYQIVGDTRTHFDDREEVAKAFAAKTDTND
jgi:UDP-N-acetylmuramoyl-L-alanyl-D-glutamate--2,6-diaminopimelate ligase